MADPVRLPTPGKDHGNWGDLLNNFLTIGHHADGSLKLPGVGDYLSVAASKTAIPTNAPLPGMTFEKIARKRGDSLNWSPKESSLVTAATDGVYAITLNINWSDSSANPTMRFVQITAAEPFHTEEQRVSTPGMNTIQSLSLVATLYTQQSIQVQLEQRSGTDQTPQISLTIVKIAPLS